MGCCAMVLHWCGRKRFCGGGLGARLRFVTIYFGANVRTGMAAPSDGLTHMFPDAAKAFDGRARCGD